ncbi:MAG: ribosomal protein S18-alanine N-acetyltransferase [Aigarchaeota archaeon]|nr:ribosomal protein S18-alanine N-acetyltransferase [Aigarchaeota archaeon]MDW8092317.1 ribosomal protein S18-alanine N-acetyltransferase [Nitrososphaerota archaeon]
MQRTDRDGLSVHIREAKSEDLPTIMHINRVSLPENYSYSFFHNIYETFPNAFLVAEVDSMVVGYIMCRVERIFSKIERFRYRRAGHVISIAVLPEYRGRGVGRRLMEVALSVLKDRYKCDEVFLEVRVSNWQAIRLYENLGFVVSEVLKHYYLDGENAYVMARSL